MLILLFFVQLVQMSSAWALEIPGSLQPDERQQVIRLMGTQSSGKFMSNPNPLGGYSGVEIGLSIESLPTRDLSGLGDKNANYEPQFQFSRLVIGKGLYHNIDLFIDLVTYSEDSALHQYGGLIKWTPYESRTMPLNFSILAHASTSDIEDRIVTESYGADWMIGMPVEDWALYFGSGVVNTNGELLAAGPKSLIAPGDPKINSKNTVKVTVNDAHAFIGISVNFENLFACVQIDRYQDPSYGAKIGIRF